MKSFGLLLISILSHAALAAPAQKATANFKLQKDFSAACAEAFKISHPDDTQGLGKKICDCAGPESKSQGATDAAIKRETAEILKNPKYEVKDQHVLDAMKYCAIETLQGLD